MKSIGLLTGMVMLGIVTVNAQEVDSIQTNYNSETVEVATGEVQGIYNTSELEVSDEGCSLIKDPYSSRQMYQLKDGYVITTAADEETVEVEYGKKGDRKLKYYNAYEALVYHMDQDGKYHYKYYYDNGCDKITVKQNKKGTFSIVNKSHLETNEVLENVERAIQKGAQTCASTAYAK